MKHRIIGDFTMKRRLRRLAAFAVGTAVACAFAGGIGQNSPDSFQRNSIRTTTNKSIQVKGPEPYAGMMVNAIIESHVPIIDHIRLVTKPPAGCEGSYGCTDSRWHTVYIYPNQSPLQLEVSFLHEMGHQWDFRELSEAERTKIKVALGWPADWPWLDSKGKYGPHGTEWGPPGEVYAEAYAWCAVGVYPGTNRKAYGWQPTRADFERVCQTILTTD